MDGVDRDQGPGRAPRRGRPGPADGAERPGAGGDPGSPATRLDRLERALVADRSRLVGLAYRITGSRVEAEDIVQEAWLRSRRADTDAVERPEAWLTTVVSRLALDSLRSARHRREAYVGPWLPEPVHTPDLAGAAPAEIAESAETLTFGFLRVLDALGPVERVVFLLADVFDVPYAEIAPVVGRSEAACRQVASRARRRAREDRPGHAPPSEALRVAEDLLHALGDGDVDRVVSLLGEDVVMVSDGGPHHKAARHPVVGPFRVGRLLTFLARKQGEKGYGVEPAVLNGEPGILVRSPAGPLYSAMAIGVDGGRVVSVHLVVNPDKLAALGLPGPA